KYVRRNDEWLSSEIANGQPESPFTPLPSDTNPIEEVEMPSEKRDFLRERFRNYDTFATNVLEFGGL
ncbi:MAG: hypothetical protein ABEL76_15465, partial [Bradymonadaceae bacterium]